MDFMRVSDVCRKSAMTDLRKGTALQPAYRQLIAAAAKIAPFLKQKKAAELDAGADAARAEAWLTECLRDEPPKPNIKSFWFGQFEDAKDGWTLYAAGSTMAIDYRSIHWAVDPAWFPRKRYFESTVLAELSKMRPKKDAEAAAVVDLGLVFPYGSLLIAEVLRRVDPALLLGKAKVRAAACGYDAGDFMKVGEITAKGFVGKPKM